MQGNTKLRTLCLSNNQFSSDSAAKLLRGFAASENHVIEHLSMHALDLNDVAATAMAELVSATKTLKAIELNSNIIGSPGAIELGKALLHNTSVTEVHLQNNEITNTGAESLARAMGKHGIITKLSLSQNAIHGDDSVPNAMSSAGKFAVLEEFTLTQKKNRVIEFDDDTARKTVPMVPNKPSMPAPPPPRT